jgi:hypothetical protein
VVALCSITMFDVYLRMPKRYFLLSPLLLLATALTVFSHGGEDHGDAKPKTAVSDKGTVTHTSRLGDIELTLKYLVLEPDTAATGRLFITKFETNQAVGDATPVLEFESANGTVVNATVEKSEQAGVFNVSIPALPEGTYTARTKVTYSGETDAATFSGIEVKHSAAASSEGSGWAWTVPAFATLLIISIAAILGGLVYFVLYAGKEETVSGETVSA